MDTRPIETARTSAGAKAPIGALLRTWRERRRLTQLDLAGVAEISPRHISFLETGRSVPSRAMVLRLAERLEIPLRERNGLLMSAGYAPMYSERPLDDPALRPARRAVELVITGHEPYPALAVDRHWTLVSANGALGLLLQDIAPRLMRPPVNVLRLALDPEGLAPRVENYAQWRTHLLARLRQQIAASGDVYLVRLLAELSELPQPATRPNARATDEAEYDGVVIPLRLQTSYGLLEFFSTTTVFGTPLDITLAELAIESFFPAEPRTAEVLSGIAQRPGGPLAREALAPAG
jgi:transcriptional regulator with XRE-family HTH domain